MRALRAAAIPRPGMLALATALALSEPAAGDDLFAVQTLDLDGRVVAAELADLDGDGRGDLLCVAFVGLPPREKREISVFYQRKDGSLPAEPDRRLPLPPDAAAYDLALLDGRPGIELILLGRDRLRVLSLAGRAPSWRELPTGVDPTMAVVQDERGLDRLRMARRGLGDELRLLIPALGRTAVLSKRGELLSVLEVGARGNYLLPQRPGPVYAESEMEIYLDHPRLGIGDVDGDGRGDVVSTNRHELRVFLQNEAGRFPSRADRRVALDRVSIEDHVRNSGAVRVEPADFDGDGRLDLLVSTSRGSLLAASTEVGIHLNRGGFWNLDRPDQTFHSDSGITSSHVIDLDGDGRVELITVRIPTGVLELVEALVTRAVDAEVSIYRPGSEQPFHEPPWQVRTLGVPWSFETFRTRGFVPTLTVDVNGDGLLDFLGSGDGDELEVYLGRRDSGYARRDGRQRLDTGGRIRFGDVDADGLTDFVLYDPHRTGATVRVGVNRGVLPGTIRRPALKEAVPMEDSATLEDSPAARPRGEGEAR